MRSAILASFCLSTILPAQANTMSHWTIRVDAAARGGPSRVKNFMFVQGSPLLAGDEHGSNEASRQFEIAAWKALDLTSESVPLIDGEPGQGLHVVRSKGHPGPSTANRIGPLGPKRDLYLDTREFDMMQTYWREMFGGKGFSRVFGVGYMPKTLSSHPSAANYHTYSPADYAEWRAVLEAAVRYLNKRGIDDPYVVVFGEPESDTIFNVLGTDGQPFPTSTEPVLREYVRLYAESQRAVKAADPGAKVSAMCAGVYAARLFRDLRQAPEQKGLDDFIAYVAEYNQALPRGTKPVVLDNICWQGYSWRDEKRMAPMAEHIQSVLARYEFDPATPQVLSGWSGGWASPRWERGVYPPHLYVPHLVYNVIEQLNPGGEPGPVAQAHYYTWNLDNFFENRADENSSLVRTVHKRISYDPTNGHAASDRNCLRPAYVAFQALKAVKDGDVLEMKEDRPPLVRSIATADGSRVRVLLVNYADTPQEARLTIERLPQTARIKDAVLRRVPKDEVCGKANWFPTSTPMSTFSNELAKLSIGKPGTATASIPLAPNAVALLEIPTKP